MELAEVKLRGIRGLNRFIFRCFNVPPNQESIDTSRMGPANPPAFSLVGRKLSTTISLGRRTFSYKEPIHLALDISLAIEGFCFFGKIACHARFLMLLMALHSEKSRYILREFIVFFSFYHMLDLAYGVLDSVSISGRLGRMNFPHLISGRIVESKVSLCF